MKKLARRMILGVIFLLLNAVWFCTFVYGVTPPKNLTNVVEIAAGERHCLALKDDGSVWSWGCNLSGQLGIGDRVNRTSAIQVNGLPPIAKIAAGKNHSLALDRNGELWAWGDNGYGQLGNVSVGGWSFVPVKVSELNSGITAIAAGSYHSLALVNGSLMAWGNNSYGQLGINDLINRSTPVWVNGLAGVTAIAAGAYFSLALKSDQTVAAWGSNSYGQLGRPATVYNSLVPITVSGLSPITIISAGGEHSLALSGTGSVYTWGRGYEGEMGDGSRTCRYSPVLVNSISGASLVKGGSDASMTLVNGVPWVWGNHNYGTSGNSLSPIRMTELSGITNIVHGYSFGAALKDDGTVWTWGRNDVYGQLGNGSLTQSPTPVQVVILPISLEVSAGHMLHSVAHKNDDTAWAWGGNTYGQLGLGTTGNKLTPQKLNINDVVAIAAGYNHTLALKKDGTVWAWGYNNRGQLGRDFRSHIPGNIIQSLEPIQVGGLPQIVAISAGADHNLALTADGKVYAWGYNRSGQVGVGLNPNGDLWDGSIYCWFLPVQVTDLCDITKISAGFEHNLAQNMEGKIYAWGSNNHGQLGDGTTTSRFNPQSISNLSDIVAFAAGGEHSLALGKDGTVKAWGSNMYGQLGDGTTKDKLAPQTVSGVNGILKVAGGYQHSMFLRDTGSLYAVGKNDFGQLGDGTTQNRCLPVNTLNIKDIISISGGWLHSLAVRYDYTLWAWGRGDWGQLGSGTGTNQTTPVQVIGID